MFHLLETRISNQLISYLQLMTSTDMDESRYHIKYGLTLYVHLEYLDTTVNAKDVFRHIDDLRVFEFFHFHRLCPLCYNLYCVRQTQFFTTCYIYYQRLHSHNLTDYLFSLLLCTGIKKTI